MSDDMGEASPLKRREILDALRIGAVPRRGLELFAVGLERFEKAIDEELATVAAGQGRFKALEERLTRQREAHEAFAAAAVHQMET